MIDPKKIAGLHDAGFMAPDVVGTVEGWRAWRVDPEPPAYGTAPKMMSASMSYIWAPRQKARAECSKCVDQDPSSVNALPGETCTCGFYSAKTLDHLRSMGYHSYDPEYGQVAVVGQLANWGKVIEGSQGWRSEFAYPAMLFVPFEVWRLAMPLVKAYGVPVKLLNLLDPTKRPEQGRDVKGEPLWRQDARP